MLIVQISADADRNSSVSLVPVTYGPMLVASTMPQAVSAVLNPTTTSNSIPMIVRTLVTPKAAASILAAADNVVRFAKDTAIEKENESKDEVSPSATVQEDDEDSEGSFTTITEFMESHLAMEEDTKDNQEAIDDD